MPKIEDIETPEGYERVKSPSKIPIVKDEVETPEGYEKAGDDNLNNSYVPSKVKGSSIEGDWPFLRKRLHDEGKGFDLEVHLNEGDFREALQYHWGVSPEVAAKAYAISKNQIPSKDILRNKDELFQFHEAGKIVKQLFGREPVEINGKVNTRAKYPYTSNWIKNPDKMAIAKDDVGILTELEGIAIRYNRPTVQSAFHQIKEGVKDIGRSQVDMAAYLKELKLRSEEQFYEDNKKIFEDETLDDVTRLNAFYSIDPLRNRDKVELRKTIQEIKNLKESEFLRPIPLAQEGGFRDFGYDVLRGFPLLATQIGMTATTGFASSMAFIAEHIFGQTYGRLKDKGVDSERSEIAAVGNATIQGAISLFPMTRLFSLFKTRGTREVVRKYIAYMASEFGEEWLQEYPEMMADVWATAKIEGRSALETAKLMAQKLPETTVQGIYSGLVGAALAGFGGSVKVVHDIGRGVKARRDLNHMLEEVQKLSESKLKDRSPELMDEFSNGVYETNDVSKEIRIPVEKIEEFYQDNPDGLETFLKDMEVLDQYKEGPTTQELIVDRATFIREYANSDFGKAVSGDVRLEVDGLTTNETEALSKNIAETLKGQMKTYGEIIRKNKIPTQAVNMWKGLSKKFGAEKAEANMSVFLSMARQLAARRGETTEQWFNRVRPSLEISEGNFIGIDGKSKKGKKGAATFTDSGALIQLYDSADVSTFLHEAFHIVTNDLKNYIDSGHSDAATIEQFNKLVEFADGKLDTAGYEKLAKSFELYLREGKAPSVALADIFRSFRVWLTNLYKTISRFDFKLNDDIRGVFDRLVASEQEMAEVKEYYSVKESLHDLLPDIPIEQKRKLILQSDKADRISLDNQVKKYSKAYFDAIGGKEQFKALAEREVSKERVYGVVDYLKGNKLDYLSLVNFIGLDAVKRIKRTHKGIVERKGKNGTSIAELVMLFDYASESDVLNELTTSKSKETAINERAETLIRERENALREELSKNESITGEESYHHEAQLMLMVAQSEVLRQQIEAKKEQRVQRLEAKVIKDAARDRLAQMPVWKATRYKDYAAAERRFGSQAVEHLKKGDLVKAHEALTLQAINHAMVLSSVEARQNRVKIEKRYKTKRINSDLKGVEYLYREAAKDAMKHYTLNNDVEVTQADALTTVPYIHPELAQTMPAWILRKEIPENFKSYRDLPMGQLIELDSAIQNIMTYGRSELKAFKDYIHNTKDALVGASRAKMSQVPDKKIVDQQTSLGKLDKALDVVASASQIMSFLMDRIDNYSYHTNQEPGPMGTMYEKTRDAEGNVDTIRKKFLEDSKDDFRIIRKADKRIEKELGIGKTPLSTKKINLEGVPLPEAQRSKGFFYWTSEQLQAFHFNLGNTQNRQRLFMSYKYSQSQIDKITSLYTKEEHRARQRLVDTLGGFYNELSRVYFNLHNEPLGKVEASEFTVLTKEGERITLKGGYFPLVYDYLISDSISNDNNIDALNTDLMSDRKANVLRTKPEDRMTKQRSETNNNFIKLSYDVLFNHVSDTAKYISYAEVLRDFNLVISDSKWKSDFIKKEGDLKYKMMRQWLSDLANPSQIRHNRNMVEAVGNKIIDHQRRMATYNILGLNIATGPRQRLSMINAVKEVGLKHMLRAIKDTDFKTHVGLESGQMVQEVLNISKLLPLRLSNIDRQLSEVKSKLRPDVNTIEIRGVEYSWSDIQDAVFSWIKMNDLATVIPVWKAAVSKYMELHAGPKLDMNKAYRYADHVVETTQPLSIPNAMNEIMRSKGVIRLVSSFMTFQFVAGNRRMFYYRALKDGKISKKEYFEHVMYDTILPGWINTTFNAKFIGQLAAGAAGSELEEYLMSLLTGPVEEALNFIVGIRDIPSALRYKKDIFSSPALEGGIKAAKAAWSVKSSLEGEKAWAETTMDLGLAVEFQLGVPALKFMKDVDKMYKDATNKE